MRSATPVTELFQCNVHGISTGCGCDSASDLGVYLPDERVHCARCEEPMPDPRFPQSGRAFCAVSPDGPLCVRCHHYTLADDASVAHVHGCDVCSAGECPTFDGLWAIANRIYHLL